MFLSLGVSFFSSIIDIMTTCHYNKNDKLSFCADNELSGRGCDNEGN